MFKEIFLHDFSRSLAQRAQTRKHVGPYRTTPRSDLSAPLFFYMATGREQPAKYGAAFRLRLKSAVDILPAKRCNGFYADSAQDTVISPLVARLPRGRGFLAGHTMGAGMSSAIETDTVWQTEEEAAHRAFDMAEQYAEDCRDIEADEKESAL